jgi:3-phosphoglycerate kinase
LNRINPDEIKFEYSGGEVHYAEATDIENHDSKQEARTCVEGGLAVLWENVRNHPRMELVETSIEEDDDKIWAVCHFKQDSVEAMASLMGELAGTLIEHDPELFAAKITPLVRRAQKQQRDGGG